MRWRTLPGVYPYTAGVFPFKRTEELPTRMFAGEGGPERTNHPATREVRRIIRTAGTIIDDFEMDRVHRFRMGQHDGGNAFDGGVGVSLQMAGPRDRNEPFALLHAEEEMQ